MWLGYKQQVKYAKNDSITRKINKHRLALTLVLSYQSSPAEVSSALTGRLPVGWSQVSNVDGIKKTPTYLRTFTIETEIYQPKIHLQIQMLFKYWWPFFCELINNSIDYHCQIKNLHKTQLHAVWRNMKKSALPPSKILNFYVIHHVACLKQFLSFRRDLGFNSHDSISVLAPFHAADVSRPLSSFGRRITASLWGRREGMQTTNEHERQQELADPLASHLWVLPPLYSGFCSNLSSHQWNHWRQMRMFHVEINEWLTWIM